MNIKHYFLAVCLIPSLAAAAEDVVDIQQGSTIRGTTELPKVLYIVPWKQGRSDDVIMQPGSSIFGEDLSPIDRDVFRRQVRFYQSLQTRDMAQGR